MDQDNQTQQQYTENNSINNHSRNSSDDIAKITAIVGYLIPFLFFLPLVIDSIKNNSFARFHANQHLLLLCLELIVFFFIGPFSYGFLGMFYMLITVVLFFLQIGIFALVIIGVVNAAQNKTKPLPLIGHITLFS